MKFAFWFQKGMTINNTILNDVYYQDSLIDDQCYDPFN